MIEDFHEFYLSLIEPERFAVAAGALILALVVGVITGPVLNHLPPFVWWVFEQMFGRVGDRLDRKGRKRADLLFRGFFVSVFAILAAYGLSIGVDWVARAFGYRALVEILVLAFCISGGSVFYTVLKLYFAMENKGIGKGSYLLLSRGLRQNFARVDDFGIARAAIGFSARDFDKGVVAPILWYIIAGLPGALIYSALAALVWRFGREGENVGFGGVMMALERLMGAVPSYFAGVLIVAASLPAPGASVGKALQFMFAKKGRAAYACGGWPVSAMAWALNVTLGGPMETLDGVKVRAAWVGPDKASAQVGHGHLRHALIIGVTAHLVLLLALCGGYLWGGFLG